MSRKNRSIVIAIAVVACLTLAPATAWAGPMSAHATMTAEAPSMVHWLGAVWERFIAFAAPVTKDEEDRSIPPANESGSSQDPWG